MTRQPGPRIQPVLAVVGGQQLRRISTTWEQFKKFMDIAHPRKGSTMELMLEA